jgi:hypothetical protein
MHHRPVSASYSLHLHQPRNKPTAADHRHWAPIDQHRERAAGHSKQSKEAEKKDKIVAKSELVSRLQNVQIFWIEIANGIENKY